MATKIVFPQRPSSAGKVDVIAASLADLEAQADAAERELAQTQAAYDEATDAAAKAELRLRDVLYLSSRNFWGLARIEGVHSDVPLAQREVTRTAGIRAEALKVLKEARKFEETTRDQLNHRRQGDSIRADNKSHVGDDTVPVLVIDLENADEGARRILSGKLPVRVTLQEAPILPRGRLLEAAHENGPERLVVYVADGPILWALQKASSVRVTDLGRGSAEWPFAIVDRVQSKPEYTVPKEPARRFVKDF